MKKNKISFLVPKCDTKASNNQIQKLKNIYGNFELNECDVIVALGGDGFMLEALHTAKTFSKPVYGMNRGTIGFLMNKFSSQNLSQIPPNCPEHPQHGPLKFHQKVAKKSIHRPRCTRGLIKAPRDS